MSNTYPIPQIGMVVSETLPFHSCRKCAKCCVGKVIPLYEPDMERLCGLKGYFVSTSKLERGITGASYKMRMVGSRCIFLDGNLCVHYDLRPDTCRRHPFIVTDNLILVNPSCPGVDWASKNAEGEGYYRTLSSGICEGIDALVGSEKVLTAQPIRRANPRRRGAPGKGYLPRP